MQLEYLGNSLNLSLAAIFPFIAKLVIALLLFYLGAIIANLVRQLVVAILKVLQLDKGAKQIGFDRLLEKGEIKRSLSELLGDIIFWLGIFVIIFSIAGIMGLSIEVMLNKIFTYMAIIFAAALLLGVGLFLATLISGIFRVITVNLGVEGAKAASRFIYYIVIVMAFLGALEELGITPDVFLPHLGVIVGAFGLAAAIAFGLGCKDMAADFLHNFFKGR
jgi:Mechanosensitive ion channel, conserved TM helix